MAKDYSANPVEVKNFTQSAEVNYAQNFQDYSEFLPEINRTESLKRFFGSTVNQLLSSGSTQSIDAYWGRLTGRNYNPENELFMPESDAVRLNYQFQPGTVSRFGGQIEQTISYINWLNRLESLGSNLNNHDRLFSEPGYVLDLPVNFDMIINYQNYYWLEGLPPLIIIEPGDPGTTIDIDVITKVSQYTTPELTNYKKVEFVTGLRVKFIGEYVYSTSGDYFADYTYYVENVGGEGGIKLIPIEDDLGNNLFPSTVPYEVELSEGWDTELWDTTAWDGKGTFSEYDINTTNIRQDLELNKTYIVMERWAQDKNPWARTNKWFSIHALRISTAYNDLELEAYTNIRTRAARPIIEFRANMELFNFCKTYIEQVDYVVSIEQVTEILSGRDFYSVDLENDLQDGDIILVAEDAPGGIEIVEFNNDFNNDFDSGNSNAGSFSTAYSKAFNVGAQITFFGNAYVVSGVGTAITLTPYNTYDEDEYVVVSKGTEKGAIYCFKDGKWNSAQTKETRSSFPLFNLYDQFKTPLNDYNNNDFNGEKIFGYRINRNGAFDRELGFPPSFTQQGSFSDYLFEWTLSNIRYNQDVTIDSSTEIRGYYFWRDWVKEEYLNGWTNIRGTQRVPIIQTQVSNGNNTVVFELGTNKVNYPTEFSVIYDTDHYKWYDHSYIDRTTFGERNTTLVWKYDTDYTINTLISDSLNDLEFVNPIGVVDADIIVTVVNDVTTTVRINSNYKNRIDAPSYNKILYRSQSNPDISGEIFLSNANQNRYFVSRNGQYLVEGEDYNFVGTQIILTEIIPENDVIELTYVADADLTNVVYDVSPNHFYNNENNPFTEVGYDDLINHMSRQMTAMPGFEGRPNNENNYHRTVRINSYDGLIRQQIFKTTPIQYLLDQEDINPIRALKNISNDYADFKKFFINKVSQLWRTESWATVRDLVDRAINDINIGKSDQFKYAHSDMAYAKQFKKKIYNITGPSNTVFDLPSVINQYGDTQNHILVWLREYNSAVGKITERPLVKGIDYYIEGPRLVLINPVNTSPLIVDNVVNGLDNVVNGLDNVVTTLSFVPVYTGTQLTIRWYDYRQLSHIPFSAVKLGFFRPTQVEFVDGVLIGHDGSQYVATGTNFLDLDSPDFDVVAAALWDFELRVFNNLVDKHFISNSMVNFDMGEFYPNPTGEFAYSITNLNNRLDDWYNRWAVRNNVTEIDTVDYDGADEFTWNYTTVGPSLGSWRSLYVYTFGTDRPHTHPWEMLGHRVKPQWWDITYSWNAGPLRTALINALKYGVVGNNTTPNVVDIRYARSSYDWDNEILVTDDGSATLNGPVAAGLVAAPLPIDAAKDFIFGDWSEAENQWRKSSEYLFALAEVFLQLKPYRIHDLFWTLRRWSINRIVTQEQWLDPNYCFRKHNSEIHNQRITDGIVSKIRVINSGTGYPSLDLEFRQDAVCYRNAEAAAYTSAGRVIGVAVTDPGRGFDNSPEVRLIEPIASSGVELEYVLDFDFHLTRLGFNTLPAEEYVKISSDSNALSERLDFLDINYMLHAGGFTDKRIISLEIDGDYNAGLVKLPESSYDILIDQSAPIKSVFYSGVKIEKVDGQGYKVSGYDLDNKFFNYLKPSTSGKQVSVTIGNTQVIKYLNWRNEVTRIPYNSVLTKRQDLFSFLLGLGQRYEELGFNNFTEWEEQARAAITWSLGNDTEPFYVNGIKDSLFFHQGPRGVVRTIDVNYDGVFNILDRDLANIRRNEMLVLRDQDKTEIAVKTAGKDLFGVGVKVVEYEHIIVINNKSSFSDTIYVPQLGVGQNRVRVVGERTRNWTGRVEAPGYIVQNTGLILNVESSVRELENDWVTSESKALERLTRQTIGYNVGYSKPTYMTNTFIGDKAAYSYEKGLRKYRGTESAIEAMTRSKNIFGAEFEHALYEEWMVRLGDYGDESEKNPIQFSVNVNKLKTNPQTFRFNGEFVSDQIDDLIIDLHKGSEDSISGDFSSPFDIYPVLPVDNTSIDNIEEFQTFTRDAGLPLIDEVDYYLGSIDEIGNVYNPTADYARIPNWSSSRGYVAGDTVRRYGKVHRLLIDSTGITRLNDDIVVRGTQVFPLVANGLTFIANNQTVTFQKFNNTTLIDPIVVSGTISNPTVPSGDTLTIDGINVNFIKTTSSSSFGDIILTGGVTNPQIVNSSSRQLTIGYANLATGPLTNVVVNFNEIDPTLTMQQIWIDALTGAAATDPVGKANVRLAALEAFRLDYITVNSVSAWQTNVMQPYFDTTTTPDRILNPQFLGSLVSANIGAPWQVEAEALIQLDLDLIAEIGGAHSETVATMISGTLTNSGTWTTARNAANNKLDSIATPTNATVNLLDFVTFVETNGSLTISAGRRINVTNPKDFVIDFISTIVSKINTALTNAGAPATISAANVGNVVVLSRTNNLAGYRLGVSNDGDIGFIGLTDVSTQGSTVVTPDPLNLIEVVNAINQVNISGVSAASVNNRLQLTSNNASLTISSSTAINDLGLPVGVSNANTTIVSTPVESSIGDIVTQINLAAIPQLTASQVQGSLLLTYIGEQLVIGNGTANSVIGLVENTFDSLTEEVQNEFVESDWEVIDDPADFSIWTIDNIGSEPARVQATSNKYNVYQTLDFQLGVLEICAGDEFGDDALIKMDKEHGISSGEFILILNSTCVPSVDGIHRVTRLQGTTGVYIDRFIQEKGFTGKVIPLRSIRFSSSNEAFASVNNPRYFGISEDGRALGLRTRTIIYVDEVFDGTNTSLKRGGVFEIRRTVEGAELFSVRNETGKTNNSQIKNGVLYSYNSGDTIKTFEVFDPLKGIIPGIADREIDIKSEVDYAYYNNSTDPAQDLNTENTWGQQNVGAVWWDLSNAIYLNYDQGSAEYRQEHWGELFPASTIDVYEWTKSPVTPDEYESVVRSRTVIDGIELTGEAYSVVDQFGELQYNWAEELEINPNTNQVETYYYFWVKNKTTAPTLDREYSVLQIANIIRDPQTQEIDWIAATSQNTLLVSSLTENTGYTDLVMKVNFNIEETNYHQEFILLAENDPATVIPEWLHIRLRDSLAGFTQAKKTYVATEWNSTTVYNIDDIVISPIGKIYRCYAVNVNVNPDGDINDDFWTLLELDELNPDGVIQGDQTTVSFNKPQPVPDLSLHPFARTGIETRPQQSLFNNLTGARRAAVEKINAQLLEINLVDSDIPWRDEFERTFMVGDLEYDIRDYWNFADWSLDGSNFERDVGDYFVENVSELAALNPFNGQIAQVEVSDDFDDRNERRQVYRYENGTWVLVFKEKATIQFNNLLWDNVANRTGWDMLPWDTDIWDRSSSAVVVEIFDSFFNKIWIKIYRPNYTDLWFHMAKYVLQEQDEVDWIFKTSYFKLVIEDSLEKQFNKYFNDNLDELFDYVNTVKPFRSKIRDAIVRKIADEDLGLTMFDTAEIRVQTNPLMLMSDDPLEQLGQESIDPESRAFRISVGTGGENYSSQIINKGKVFLGLDIGPNDTVIPFLNNGLGKIASYGAIWIGGERIEYTGLSNPFIEGFGSGFTKGFDSGFGGVTLLIGVTRGTQGTIARPHKFASIMEQEASLFENIILNDYGNTLRPAWNELGDGLLDSDNLDSNGIIIRGQGNVINILNISNSFPVVVTVDDTSLLTDGMLLRITDVIGMTEINNVTYTIRIIDDTTFSLEGADSPIDSTSFTPYVSGGVADDNKFGTIDLYGDLLLTKWLIDQAPADAIGEFHSQLSDLIEDYYSNLYVELTADMGLITADENDYTADGTGSPGPL